MSLSHQAEFVWHSVETVMKRMCLIDIITILLDIIRDSYDRQVKKLITQTSRCSSVMLDISPSINITAPPLPLLSRFYPSEGVLCEMGMLLCFFKNSLASLMGKIHWITQKEMQLPAPSRILITEP